MIVTAREFTSAAEMREASVLAHARCFNPKAKPPAMLALPAPVVAPKPAYVPFSDLPEWKRQNTSFDAHVIASVRIIEMIKSGEIEITQLERRTIQQIVLEVLERFPGVSVAQVRGAGRCRAVVIPRQLAMWTVRQERTDLSLPAIGRWFGGRDHTTVLHAIRKVEERRAAA